MPRAASLARLGSLLLAIACGGAQEQPADTAATAEARRDSAPAQATDSSIYANASSALGAGKSEEARKILRDAQQGASPERILLFEFNVGDSYLYDGDVEGASRIFAGVERDATKANIDSLRRMAHFGLALAEASAGRAEPARAHLRQMFSGNDSASAVFPRGFARAVIYAMVGPSDSALAALGRIEGDTASAQFVHAFRGLALLTAGRCPDAVAEVAKAPRAQGPMVLAVKARCAAVAGKGGEATALRDSTFAQSAADPLLEAFIAARAVARRVP